MPYVAHLMLVMVLNLPEQCSFQDLLFHPLFMPKSAEKSASRMDKPNCSGKSHLFQALFVLYSTSTNPTLLHVKPVNAAASRTSSSRLKSIIREGTYR